MKQGISKQSPQARFSGSARFPGRAAAALAGLAVIGAAAAPPAAWGGEAPTLPGGASSLRESYGDWSVTCGIVEQGEAKTKVKTCSITQEVHEAKSNQRLMSAQIVPAAGNTAAVTLVLPVGVSLADGAALKVDQNPDVRKLPFKTCLPAGCIALGTLDAKALAAMRPGQAWQINIRASGDNKNMSLAFSLKGFANAYDRAQALLGAKK
jgi:invasion protein IalB